MRLSIFTVEYRTSFVHFTHFLQKLMENPVDEMVVRCSIRANIILEKFDEVGKTLQGMNENTDAEILYLKAFFESKTNNVERAISILNGIQEELRFLDCWLLRGTLYWDGDDYKNAVDCFFRVSYAFVTAEDTFIFVLIYDRFAGGQIGTVRVRRIFIFGSSLSYRR